ncbi:hypothetical protein IAU59_006245 [Kwoniella sp. CBS 9459]
MPPPQLHRHYPLPLPRQPDPPLRERRPSETNKTSSPRIEPLLADKVKVAQQLGPKPNAATAPIRHPSQIVRTSNLALQSQRAAALRAQPQLLRTDEVFKACMKAVRHLRISGLTGLVKLVTVAEANRSSENGQSIFQGATHVSFDWKFISNMTNRFAKGAPHPDHSKTVELIRKLHLTLSPQHICLDMREANRPDSANDLLETRFIACTNFLTELIAPWSLEAITYHEVFDRCCLLPDTLHHIMYYVKLKSEWAFKAGQESRELMYSRRASDSNEGQQYLVEHHNVTGKAKAINLTDSNKHGQAIDEEQVTIITFGATNEMQWYYPGKATIVCACCQRA